MATIRRSRNDEVVLFDRDASPRVYCLIKKPDGSWWQKSTGTTDVDEAQKRAEAWHDDFKFKARYNLPMHSKSFSEVADIYLTELQAEIDAGLRNQRHMKDYKPVVERYLKAYFKHREIDTITSKDVLDYKHWRMSYWTTGPGSAITEITYERKGKKIKRPIKRTKPPSQSAITGEDVVLRGIFNTALKHNYIKEFQMPLVKSKTNGTTKHERKAAFTLEEYRKLMTFMRTWVTEGTNQERRKLLRDYIRFLIHTGLRPGTETDNLTWERIVPIRTPKGNARLRIAVTGKTGHRSAIAKPEAASALGDIQKRYTKANGKGWPPAKPPKDGPVFILPTGEHVKHDYMRGLFEDLLTDAGMLYDNAKRKRTAYSCRHTFAHFQLIYTEVDVYTLAIQMGNSVAIIEKYYGHLKPELAADKFV